MKFETVNILRYKYDQELALQKIMQDTIGMARACMCFKMSSSIPRSSSLPWKQTSEMAQAQGLGYTRGMYR